MDYDFEIFPYFIIYNILILPGTLQEFRYLVIFHFLTADSSKLTLPLKVKCTFHFKVHNKLLHT